MAVAAVVRGGGGDYYMTMTVAVAVTVPLPQVEYTGITPGTPAAGGDAGGTVLAAEKLAKPKPKSHYDIRLSNFYIVFDRSKRISRAFLTLYHPPTRRMICSTPWPCLLVADMGLATRRIASTGS